MPSKPKPDNSWMILVFLAAAGYFLLSSSKAPNPQPDVSKADVAAASAFPDLRRSYADVCNEAATLIEAKQLANEEALLKWLAPKTGAARESSFRQFYLAMDKDLPTEFAGKEAEVAAWFRRVARSW